MAKKHFSSVEEENTYQGFHDLSLSNTLMPELKAELEAKLERTWSPEQIAGKYRTEGLSPVCFKTIYRWLYEGRLQVGVECLTAKGKTSETC